jgi:MinD-like ATPase involved in chromosome partitioning or flagellar assembly
VKVTVAGKGGVGKTTISALLAELLAAGGLRTLAVDCDPNPNLAESFGLDSRALDRFSRDGLRRAGGTLELSREPRLVEVKANLWLLGGPPSATPLADAVARGIAGVLLGERFDAVVTDLGAGPELARIAVGGVLNPADVCVVLSDGGYLAAESARQIAAACAGRGVAALPLVNRRGEPEAVAAELSERLSAQG